MLLRVLRRLLLLPMLCLPLAAHEVPAAVEVNIWLRPQAERLDLLLRLPLRALRDIPFPELPNGELDTARLAPALPPAIKTNLLDALALKANGQSVSPYRIEHVQLSLPSDRSFEDFSAALAHTASALNTEPLRWDQAFLDVHATTAIPGENVNLSLSSRLHHLATTVSTSLRVLFPNGTTRPYHWTEDPGPVELDPSALQAAANFIKLGFAHILEGTDHILFVLCLIIPLQSFRQLLWVVTAFTVAHSITLSAAAYGWAPNALWFHPLVETMIAVSILYMALENICRAPQFRWPLAFAFGLIHGFGFSFALSESMQFAGSHLLLSLLSFNFGVEFGQLVILAIAAPLLRRAHSRTLSIVLSAIIAHTAWHWLLERWEKLKQFPVPALETATALRWLAVSLLFFGVGCWLHFRRAVTGAKN